MVDVALEDVFIARVAEPGAVFGDISFLLDQPHSATVIAAEPSSFHVVEDPEAFLEAEPRVAIYVAQVLARRLNAVNHLLAEARHRVEEPDRPPAYLLRDPRAHGPRAADPLSHRARDGRVSRA